MRRTVTAELLDELPPTDAAAMQSRRDLRRINAVMGNHRFLARVLRATLPISDKPRLLDLATGDGTQIMRVAKVLGRLGAGGELVLVDRHNLVAESTRAGLARLGWSVITDVSDIFSWMRRPVGLGFDAIVTNLFLHHLPDESLKIFLEAVAQRTRVFAAVEPQRGAWQLLQSHLVGLLGCNRVTRRDAVASVRGGFHDRELARLWPHDSAWLLHERSAGLASHVFVAQRSRRNRGSSCASTSSS
jgi:SAM-dependent methyltransferase